MEEIQITSKFALLTTADYIKLNHALSVAKGYDLEKDTARCFPIVPQLAKIDIVVDANGVETFGLLCVAFIDVEAQESYSDLLKGIELVDSYIPAEISVEELIAEGLTQPVIDWELEHLRFFHEGLKVVWLESEAPSIDKEPILEELGSKLTVIVVDNEN